EHPAVTMAGEAVRAHLAVDLGEERGHRRRAPRAGDPALRVDDDLRDAIGKMLERDEREQRRRDVAARVRDEARVTDPCAIALGEAVDRVARVRRQPERVGEVDHARTLAEELRRLLARELVPAGEVDDVVGADAPQRGAALVERDVHVRQPRKDVGDRRSGLRTALEDAERDRRMAVDETDQLGGGVSAGADDVGGDHGRDSDNPRIASRVAAIEASTASGCVDPAVRFAATDSAASTGASGTPSATASRRSSGRPSVSASSTRSPTRRCASRALRPDAMTASARSVATVYPSPARALDAPVNWTCAN